MENWENFSKSFVDGTSKCTGGWAPNKKSLSMPLLPENVPFKFPPNFYGETTKFERRQIIFHFEHRWTLRERKEKQLIVPSMSSPRLSLRKLILRLLWRQFICLSISFPSLTDASSPSASNLIKLPSLRQSSFEVPTNPVIGATDLCRVISWQ